MPYIFESLWLIPSRSCLCFEDFNSQGIFTTVEVKLFLTLHIISTVLLAHSSRSLCLVPGARGQLRQLCRCVYSFPLLIPTVQLTLKGSLREGRLPGLLCLLPCICSVAAHCSQLNCVSRN